ncbi:MAG: hypothetical protein RJB62_881, partial [Pseudomonadota bacterium]
MTAESGSQNAPRGGSPNDILEATSFLFGTNASFIEGLYAQYQKDPSSVDGTWRAFFEALGDGSLTPAQLGQGPAWRRGATLAVENGELISALTGDWGTAPAKAAAGGKAATPKSGVEALAHARDSIRVIQLVRAYRVIGHLEADLDPLKLEKRVAHPQLQPSFYGFQEQDLDRKVYTDGVLGLESATPREIV